MNLRMRTRLYLSSLLSLVVTLVAIVVGLVSVRMVTSNLSTMYRENFPGISLLLNIDRDLQQALVAERSMLTAESAQEIVGLDKIRLENLQQAADRWNRYKALPLSAREKEGIARYEAARKEWQTLSGRVAELVREGTYSSLQEARALSVSMGTPKFEATRGEVDDIGERIEEATLALNNQSASIERSVRIIQLATSVFAVTLAAGLSLRSANQILRPIQSLTAALKDIAMGDGDLTVRLNDKAGDEMSEVAKWFNSFMENLQGLIRSISATALEVAATSGTLAKGSEESARITEQMAETVHQIASASQDQSTGAGRTAVAVDQLNAAILRVVQGTESQTMGVRDSLSASSRADESLAEVAEILQESQAAARRNAEYAERGSLSVTNVMESMQSIRATTANISSGIGELDGYSQEIGKIIEVINGIAAQTNLLALNAAIEAARAGEHGRGFAVVSEEVRKLAEGSSRETKAIAALVDRIRQAINKAVGAAETGTKEVETGSTLAQEASASLTQIAQGAADTERMVVSLFDATNVLAAASRSVQESMGHIEALAGETSGTASEMRASADEVRNLVDTVAAVSEEAAASTEEVSASASEMAASIHEVYESAQSLAVLASNLRNAVSRFRV